MSIWCHDRSLFFWFTLDLRWFDDDWGRWGRWKCILCIKYRLGYMVWFWLSYLWRLLIGLFMMMVIGAFGIRNGISSLWIWGFAWWLGDEKVGRWIGWQWLGGIMKFVLMCALLLDSKMQEWCDQRENSTQNLTFKITLSSFVRYRFAESLGSIISRWGYTQAVVC